MSKTRALRNWRGLASSGKIKLGILGLFFLFSVPFVGAAQELVIHTQELVQAEVVSVVDTGEQEIPGTEVTAKFQTLEVRILEGELAGSIVLVENDHLFLKEHEKFYLLRTSSPYDGSDFFAVSEPLRLTPLFVLGGIFLLVVFLFGGLQGIRGLVALGLSLFFILFVMLPGILEGYSPILVSIGVASLITIVGSYITHGLTKTTTAAVVGMLGTVFLSGLLAYFSIHFARLSGFSSEEAVYLNFNTGGTIDFVALLFGGIIIGLLGVLYDAAIGQSVVVDELGRIAPHVPRKMIYKRALRVGREHVGALVNTLAIAYVGTSLPLLLFFYGSSASPFVTINQELFATEIVRTLVGSIGIVLAVPLTTAIAVFILVPKKVSKEASLVEAEKDKLQAYHHHH